MLCMPIKPVIFAQTLVTHAYNLSYLRSWDQEDSGSRPAQAKTLTPISTNSWVQCYALSPQNTWETEIGGITIPGQFAYKVYQNHLSGKKLGMVQCACDPSYSLKSKIIGSWARPAWSKSKTLISKISTAKGMEA
jgi:hypothetical protein